MIPTDDIRLLNYPPAKFAYRKMRPPQNAPAPSRVIAALRRLKSLARRSRPVPGHVAG